jgi:Domain of unknown function (DUF4386)
MKWLSKIGIARTTGLIYLLVVVSAILTHSYVPSQLFVSGDAVKTVENIRASQDLFRVGIAAGFVCYLTFLLLPLAFYKFLSHVNRNAAVLMVIFAVSSVPITLGNMVNKIDVLTLLSGKAYLASYSSEQLQSAVMLSLARYNNGLLVAEVFWGLWLLPLGYLVFRSGLLPKVLGIFLVAGCFGYVIDVFATITFSAYLSSAIADFITMPASIGELGTCFWLVVFGARKQAKHAG